MSDSHSPESIRPTPPDRPEALVEFALGGAALKGLSRDEQEFVDLIRLVRDSVAHDSLESPAGVPIAAIARAKALASLLPTPAASGVRAWWDRTLATIAACLHDDATALAHAGLRRGGAVRQVAFEARAGGEAVAIDLEIERRIAPERGSVRGQVTRSARQESPVAVAMVRQGLAEAVSVVDGDGFFELEVPAGRWDLALHLGEDGAVVLPDLEVP